jgi:hemerythrin-like domain-containing protein
MSNPVELLMQEHEVITKALHNVLDLKPFIVSDPEKFKMEMKSYISFFRNYADNFHHQKEERILFVQMKNKREELADGVIKEMYDNHEDFREMLSEIESLTDEGNYEKAFHQFENYNNALLDHIAVEDFELFQTALSIFSEDELEKLSGQFSDNDRELGNDYKSSMENMVN